MKRGGPLRRTALRVESKRHAREERVLAKVKRQRRELVGDRCEAQPILGPCWGPIEAHHLRKRSQGGANTIENIKLLCRFHNQWVEDHPAEAERLGLVDRPRSLNATVTISDPPSYLYGRYPHTGDTEPAA